jgi:hypothetical protein
MRFALLLLAAAGLAGCDSASVNETADGAPVQPGSSSGDPAPPSDGAPPAAASAEGPAAPAAKATAIPAAFLGVYDQSAETCARPSEYRLTVSAGELKFHESIGTVRSVAVEGPNIVSIEADYQGEGESWRTRQRLARDGDRLTISGDGNSTVRVRCPGPIPS